MLRDLFFRLQSLWRGPAVEAELDEELRFHLEQQSAKYQRAGLSPGEAQRRARLEFGGLDQIKEHCRDARGVTILKSIAQDLRYGFRMLRKDPGFTAVVVLTLGLSIGANTALFSVVEAVFLRSLPVHDPAHLVLLQWTAHNLPQNVGTSSHGDCAEVRAPQGELSTSCALSYPFFKEVRKQKQFFLNATAFAGPAQMNLKDNGPSTIALGDLVSGDYFKTLGVRSTLGRTLLPEDDLPAAPAVAVLDYGYWQRTFSGSASVVGKTIRLNNALFTIVGVADQSFTRLTPGKAVDLWVSLNQAAGIGLPWSGTGDRHSWWLSVVARLQPGVSIDKPQAALNLLFAGDTLHGANPVWKKSDRSSLSLLPAQSGLIGFRSSWSKILQPLAAAVGIVLLIACANVAGLLLARAAARQKEFAVRLTLGAGRTRLIRQLLTESLLLSSLGGVLGVSLAFLGARGLVALFGADSSLQVIEGSHSTTSVLVFCLAATLSTGLVFGLLPAIQGSQTNPTANRAARKSLRLGFGSTLVMLQVALSIVVLVAAGLLIRTLDRLSAMNPGFDPHNLVLFSLDAPGAGYKGRAVQRLYEDMRQRLAAIPGVTSASYSSDALLDSGLWTEGIHIQGQSDMRGVQTQMLAVGPDFPSTMKIAVRSGRMLRSSDLASDRSLAMVNQEFVRRFVGARSPLGLHFGGGGPKDPSWEIIGVIADAKYATLRAPVGPTAYVPQTDGSATFSVRTKMTAVTFFPLVRKLVNQVDSSLPVMRLRTQSKSIDRLLGNERLLARLFAMFGLLALALVCVGLYGLLSYEVTLSTRELGIRIAFGAGKRNTLLLVLRRSFASILVGSFVGIIAALTVNRLLETLLYEVRPTDPLTFAAVIALLVAVGVTACLSPARRAVKVDPAVALRYE